MRTDKYVMGFGERLTEAIKAKGMTNAELTKRLGYKNPSLVYTYTALNQMPCAYTLARMAVILNVSTDWLLGLEKNNVKGV